MGTFLRFTEAGAALFADRKSLPRLWEKRTGRDRNAAQLSRHFLRDTYPHQNDKNELQI